MKRETAQALVNKALGRGSYTLREQLGGGGFARVYAAVDRKGMAVAVKVTCLQLVEGCEGDDPEAIEDRKYLAEKLAREPEVHRRLSETGALVPHFIESGKVDDGNGKLTIVNVMERLETLQARLDALEDNKRLEALLCMVCNVAEAAVVMNRLQLIHRDIKPGNVLVRTNRDGSVTYLLADFGTARNLTEAANEPERRSEFTRICTPLYAAPEINDPSLPLVGNKCDVYSIAKMLRELLHKQLPTAQGALIDRVNAYLDRCLQRQPEARPTSRELADVMHAFAAECGRAAISAAERAHRARRMLMEQGTAAAQKVLGYVNEGLTGADEAHSGLLLMKAAAYLMLGDHIAASMVLIKADQKLPGVRLLQAAALNKTDRKKACALLEQLADEGFAAAAYYLGKEILNGRHPGHSPRTGLRHMARSAASGYPAAVDYLQRHGLYAGKPAGTDPRVALLESLF